jgi:hypothetical protein
VSARVLVGTVDGLHLFDDGSPGGTELAGRRVTALAPSDDDGAAWVAVLDGRTVVAGKPGAGWEETATVSAPDVHCVAGVAGGALVGTAEAHLLRVQGDESGPRVSMVAAFDDVAGRESWYTPWGGPADTRSLAVAGDGTVYVNVHVGGIVRSTGGDSSWEPTIDIDTDVHQVVTVPGSPTVLAPSAYGLAVSDDGGDTWRVDTDGLHATYSRAVAVAGDDVLVSASTGPGGERAAVYRYRRERPGGAGRFERCRDGLPEWLAGNVDTHTLAATPDLAAFGTADGTVFGSTDAGRTWDVLASDLPRITCVAIAP